MLVDENEQDPLPTLFGCSMLNKSNFIKGMKNWGVLNLAKTFRSPRHRFGDRSPLLHYNSQLDPATARKKHS